MPDPTDDGRSTMGALESATYRGLWRDALAFRSRIPHRREEEPAHEPNSSPGGFEAVRRSLPVPDELDEDDDGELASPVVPRSQGYPPNPTRIAASLMLSRSVDGRLGLGNELVSGAPVVVIDVADTTMLDALKGVWRRVLFGSGRRLSDIETDIAGPRDRHDGFYLLRHEPAKSAAKSTLERTALEVLPFALPIIAISPAAPSHVPACLIAAATHRITVSKPDGAAIERTIRIVTGKPCRDPIDPEVATGVSLADLAIAIRFDRDPAECITELRRLSAARVTSRSPREIALADLHGMPEARAWADGALSDLAAWKRGEIAWEAAASCAVLVGPPGTGKTLFCESFARNVGPFIACSYARWQSDGEGHLGHMLRAMARDFQAARDQAPSVILVDEIDSFPDRASVTHSHRDYVRAVGNAILDEISRKREGVFVLGCSNAIETCDPALLRAGRLETIIRVGPPGPADLERIMRVKLGRDLSDEPLDGFAELAIGMTGADVEKTVDDARRAARREKRPLGAEDLRKAIVGDDVPEQMRWRTAVHEAGHIVAEVVLFGPADVIATTAANRQRLGISVRTQVGPLEGTAREYRARMVILLAGRTAEETVLREPSHGSSSDIEVATTLACAMHGSLGLAGPNPLVYLGPSHRAREFLHFADVREAVAIELADAERVCREMLQARRPALIAVARRLFERGRIDGWEVERIIRPRRRRTSAPDTRLL